MDPEIKLHPVKGDRWTPSWGEINKKVENDQRILVTTLTKRMAEDLTDYYARSGWKSDILHSEISTLERIDIIDDLRRGEFDVYSGSEPFKGRIGPSEVGLVGILDADKEGISPL